MAIFNEIKTDAITRIALAACKTLSRLSDDKLTAALRALRPVVGEPAAREGLDELIDALSAGPPNTTLLKRMMAESKYEELRDIMQGLFSFKEIDIENINR